MRQGSPRRSGIRRLTARAWVSLIVLLGVCAVSASAWNRHRLTSHPDYDSFSRACSACHPLRMPLDLRLSRAAWERQVNLCVSRSTTPIKPGDQEAALRFLWGLRSFTDADVYKGQCLRCHDEATLSARRRSEASWRSFLNRHVQVNAHRLSLDDIDPVMTILDEKHLTSNADAYPGELAGQLMLERRCAICHTWSFLDSQMEMKGNDVEKWKAVVSRMAQTYPGTIPESEISELIRLLFGGYQRAD